MHAPYILPADDLDDFSGILQENPSILAADDFLGARYRKAMTPQKAMDSIFSPGFVCFNSSGSKALSFLSLVFLNSLVNFKQGISLVICAFSLVFPRFQWVRQGTTILG